MGKPGLTARERMTAGLTSALVREAALAAGFDRCGIARAGRPAHAGALDTWLERGDQASMEWMRRTGEARKDPALVLEGVRSIVVLATNYWHAEKEGAGLRIARYARGDDYHDFIPPRMLPIESLLAGAGGRQRSFVDSGPVMERDWAAEAGLSWHGKSTMGISPQLGTWFLVSVIMTTLELEPDAPIPHRCGSCERCIRACPTGAIPEPYRLDARRCISYLTIENKGPIPAEFRRPLGDRIFGCDDCLSACPWNRFARESRDARTSLRPEVARMQLPDFLSLDDISFKRIFRGSPVLRAKRRGLLRNVCVAMGNTGTREDLPALERACSDPEPLVREHAAWAVEEILGRG